MTRPTVLVATTNPAMAYALKERLKNPCCELGLRLDVCPDGDERDVGNQKVRAYDSAEALFETLEKRDPMELADTLVVLDVGAELENAFSPAATKDDRWHVTERRAGVAVELLLRFPQVFPVFLSPVVPVPDDETENQSRDEKNVNLEVVKPTWRNDLSKGNWGSFFRLRNEICTKHKPGQPDLEACKSLYAFHVPLHFVSPLEGGAGLASTLARFARGMRCWFDPTGLRTLVRNRFLGTIFDNNEDWTQSRPQREVLLKRLNNVCVAIDEEREFAVLNAYTAYKFGRRAWIVTTFAEFDEKPLWVLQDNESDKNNVVILRDIDLRFPDIPEKASRGPTSVRGQLKSVSSPIWEYTKEAHNRLGGKWVVRAVSSNAGVKEDISDEGRGQTPESLKEEDEWSSCQQTLIGLKNALNDLGADQEEKKRLLQSEIIECEKKLSNCEQALDLALPNLKYQGLKKPIVTLYDLSRLLNCQNTVAAELKINSDMASFGGHGAPYLNLDMANSLLRQSRRFNRGPVENMLGALLAGESYELLLGMSLSTALEALLLQHKHEVMAEVEFPGVSHAISITQRQKDVEAILRQHVSKNKNMKNMFLSQYWSELKMAYRNGEQFTAAEASNVRSLVHGKWLPNWTLLGAEWSWLDKPTLLLKTVVVNIATSLRWWFVASIAINVIAWIGYHLVSCECNPEKTVDMLKWCEELPKLHFSSLFSDVVLSSITLQPMGLVSTLQASGVLGTLAVILHLGFAYVLFGLLISMLYRKVTRSY